MDSAPQPTPQVESQSRKARATEKSPLAIVRKEPDLTGGTELEYIRLLSGYVHNADASYQLGSFFASGAKISGIVKRITKMPAGDVYITVSMSANSSGGDGEETRWAWFGPGCQIFGDLL